MAYITSADLVIEEDELTTISQGNTANTEKAIDDAMDEARTYLDHHFDLDDEFGKTGTERSSTLVSRIADMAVFHLYKATPADAMPERRLFFYQEAQGFLKAVRDGKLTLNIKTNQDADGETDPSRFRYGSNTKISQHGY